MPLSADLLAVLACPSPDHAPLRLVFRGETEELECTVCASRFPVSDDIPVLLADDAVLGPNGLGVPAAAGGHAPAAAGEPAS